MQARLNGRIDPQETLASLAAQVAVTREAVIRLQDEEGRT